MTSSSKLYIKSYSAEWIDLQSKDSCASPSIVPPPNRIEPPLSGAVSVSTKNDKLITFGGYAEISSEAKDTPPQRFVVNDLWKFVPYQETDSWGWTKIEQDSNEYIPGPRLASAMAILSSSNQFVLLGGWDPQTGATPGEAGLLGLNDVWRLQIDVDNGKGRWECLIQDKITDDESVVRPPQRNAATLSSISATLLPNDITRKKEDDENDDDASYFILQGGWYPFKTTYNDNYLLKVSPK